MERQWFVYLLTNYTNAVLYTGITNNLQRRVLEHQKGLIKHSFTNKYHLYKLIWFSVFTSPEDAIAVEKKIKGWKREKKLRLIKDKNPTFIDLYAAAFGDLDSSLRSE